MPPKKAAAGKKSANEINKSMDKKNQEETGIPQNECNFKISMELMHEAGHYMKLKYDWISENKADPAASTFPVIDTGFLKDWTLIRIEGEEPVPVEAEVDPKDQKKSAAALKKGAPAKGGPPKGVLEEITDNRPRQVSYIKDFAEESNGVGLVVSEEIANKFAHAFLNLQVFDVNRETQEEKHLETIEIDLSCLLFPKDQVDFNWRFDKLKTQELHYVSIRIQSEKPLLSEFLAKKLNPLQINLVSAKDIPFKTEPKYKPIHAQLKFVDSQQFKTLEMPQQPACRFMHKHVFLVGSHDPVLFKEMLATRLVRVYLHDNDEYVAEDADASFSVGQAQFTFKDFLRPFCKELKLRSDIFPMKRVEADNTQNLDLNTTARKNEKTIEKFSPYLINSSYCVIQANLSYPIGSFNLEKELQAIGVAGNDPVKAARDAAIEKEEEGRRSQLKSRESANSKGRRVPSGKGKAREKSATRTAVKKAEATKDDTIATIEKTVTIDPEEELKLKAAEEKEKSRRATGKGPPADLNAAIFERMIIIVPYKAPDQVKQIENAFVNINLAGLNLDNQRYLNTKELSEEERKNRALDFLGGFEIMDHDFRMFVFEGLGGEGRGMDQFYRANERQRPNDRKFKMLYNPEVRFKNRVYLDFNVAIKKIRLRDTLTKIMGSPDVYLRSKVPEDMYDTLQKFAEIRKLDRAALIRDFNLYPETDNLLTLERKYGDSLGHEDLYGFKQRRKRRMISQDGSTAQEFQSDHVSEAGQTAASSMGQTHTTRQTKAMAIVEAEEKTVDFQRTEPKRNKDTDARNHDFESTLKMRSFEEPKNAIATHKAFVASLNTGKPLRTRIEVPDGVETYGYGSQKLNIYEFQKDQLRKQIAEDPSNFYTYSKEHLSLAFPVVNENEIKMKAKEANEKSWKTKSGFDNVMKKTNYNEHPKKPPTSVIEDLQIPYVEQLMDKKDKLKGQVYHPEEDGKADFMSKVKNNEKTFSQPGYFKTVFISGEDMVKETQEVKQRELDEFNKKVVVENKHFYVNTREQASHQIDKHKNLRQDEVKKIGLRLGTKKLRELTARQIVASKEVAEGPVSTISKEAFIMNEQRIHNPQKTLVGTQILDAEGRKVRQDFTRYTQHPNYNKATSQKVHIQPVASHEKTGPKYGA